jgi:hypothetical protein
MEFGICRFSVIKGLYHKTCGLSIKTAGLCENITVSAIDQNSGEML